MSDPRTVPHGATKLPVRTLKVTVLEGPDGGLACVASSDRLTVGTAPGNDLVLTDPTVSRYHLELAAGSLGVDVLDHGSTNGTAAGSVRITRASVPAGATLRLGKTLLRVDEGDDVNVELHGDNALGGLRGESAVMRQLMARVRRAAQSDAPVLLVGESGTGKELVARALAEGGKRAGRPLVTVDCGALAPTLVASELFGHERGAFTGADAQHVGAFERADGGTLFLDEIGELPGALQATLLGVLERRRFRRLGGKRELSVDVRIISATNRDLRAEVNAGTFRLDLYYRLAVVRLEVPPLREHPEDIPLLVEHFLRECGHDGPVEALLSPGVLDSLKGHRWPGNVRELRNLVESIVAMGEAPPVADGPGPEGSASGAAPATADLIAPLLDLAYRPARQALLHEFEGRYLRRLLERARGNVARAARAARMDRSYLIELLSRHKLR